MRKTLSTLIRLQKSEIDRLRVHHNQLLDHQDSQFDAIEKIATQIGEEQKYCHSFRAKDEIPEAGIPNFGNFSQRMKIRREGHEKTLEALEPQIEKSLAALTEAFAERKRYEILSEKRAHEEQEEYKTAQQQFLDENTVLRYARRLG